MRRIRRSRRRAILLTLVAAALLFALLCPVGRCLSRRPTEKVIVVGAGVAGLAAAAALSGLASVLILEAQDRLGGRVHTNRSLGGVPIELGAAWIHRADGNLVSGLAAQYGCRTVVSENKRLVVYGESGSRVDATTTATVYGLLSKRIMPALLRQRRRLREDGHDDLSLGALMASMRDVRQLAGVSRCVLDFLLFRDIVQDHTADLWQTSAARYDTDHYGGRGKDHVLPGGYDCIVNGLAKSAAPAEIRSGRQGEVTKLMWGAHGVSAATADGLVHTADRVIVTVPLGVLKAGLGDATPAANGRRAVSDTSATASAAAASAAGAGASTLPLPPPQPPREVGAPIRFEPSLPSAQRLAIHRLGWGEALKVGLRFPVAFWPADAHFLGKVGGGCDNLGSARHMEFLNVAMYVDGSPPVLLMETEQAHARELAALDDKGILREVTGALRRMYPESYVEPVGHVIARLGQNPFQRGAFTYMPTGATHQLHTTLGAPLAGGRLLIAGEHTSALHAGTVHGAVVAGRKAAAHALAAMAGGDAMRGGELYEEEYTRKLFTQIYGSNGGIEEDGAEEEEEWDRNP